MFQQAVQKLKRLYYSVDDVDFVVGALLETPQEDSGAKIGPTARCILADSFNRYKTGDRYFYDVRDQPGSFTSGTLNTYYSVRTAELPAETTMAYLR